MLIQFSVRNFMAFREKATLSLVASNYDKDSRAVDNIIEASPFNLRILKSAVIYGANASGKSKFLEAMMFMKHFVITSSKDSQKGDPIDIEPFKLSEESEDEPSEFEIVFAFENVMYRYGFEVNRELVVAEWLFYKPKTKEVELYYRDHQDFNIHPRKFSKGATLVRENMIRDNALMISVAAQFNESISTNVVEWFSSVGAISGLREESYEGFTMFKTNEPNYKSRILELLKAADLGIDDIQIEMLDLTDLPKDMPKEIKDYVLKKAKEGNAKFVSDTITSHKRFDKNRKPSGKVDFSMADHESSGTRKFFALTGPVIDCLENGYPLFVDELDSKLHPNLVCKIVSLFNSREHNPRNAQLIFNTHDTNLLSSGLFRRDQVWFTQKDKYGEAKLYSLGDFKSDEVRKSEPFEENYLRGKYGAVPFLSFFDQLPHQNSLVADENEG